MVSQVSGTMAGITVSVVVLVSAFTELTFVKIYFAYSKGRVTEREERQTSAVCCFTFPVALRPGYMARAGKTQPRNLELLQGLLCRWHGPKDLGNLRLLSRMP